MSLAFQVTCNGFVHGGGSTNVRVDISWTDADWFVFVVLVCICLFCVRCAFVKVCTSVLQQVKSLQTKVWHMQQFSARAQWPLVWQQSLSGLKAHPSTGSIDRAVRAF